MQHLHKQKLINQNLKKNESGTLKIKQIAGIRSREKEKEIAWKRSEKRIAAVTPLEYAMHVLRIRETIQLHEGCRLSSSLSESMLSSDERTDLARFTNPRNASSDSNVMPSS